MSLFFSRNFGVDYHRLCAQVYGAMRLTANILSMTTSEINIIASSNEVMIAASTVEASNRAYIQVSGESLLRLEII